VNHDKNMSSASTDNPESEHLRHRPEPYWQPLFNHMSDNYGLTLTEDEMHQIARAVDKCRVNPWTLCAHCKHWRTVVEPNYQVRGLCTGSQSPNIGLKTRGDQALPHGGAERTPNAK
jgi:hypothetical protein